MQPISLKTFNGLNINDGADYQAHLINAGVLPAATNVFVQNMQADAADSQGYTVGLRTPLVFIRIKDYADRHALGEQLKRWLKRGTRGRLVATFTDDGLDYFLNCAVVNIIQEQGNPLVYIAQLESADTAWRAVDPDTDTWNVTGVGGTHDITVGGGDETRLSLTLTSVTGGVVGYDYQNIYRLTAVKNINYGTRPWCININSSTLVGAGKLRADMYDYQVLVNGKVVPRWIANPNTASTNIWFNAPIGRGEELTLKTAIASSGNISAIVFQATTANKEALKRMPAAGVIYHGTEWLSYTRKDSVNCKVTGIKRGIYGTTKQAHSANDVFVLIPAVIVTRYGNASATDPSLDDDSYDDNEPLFDLSSSNNTQWVYTASTKFYDPDRPDAPGGWSPVLERAGDVSATYAVKENAESGDAAMGGIMGSYYKNGAWQSETGKAGWILQCPGGFSEVTMTGRKYLTVTGRFPAKAGLQRSADGATWYSVYNESAPGTLSSWSSFTRTAVSVATTSKHLFFGLQGTVTKATSALAMIEGLTGTVKFYTTNLPSGALLGETGNFSLDLEFSNQETSDSILLDYPMVLNTAFDLDGELFTVTYDGANMSDAMRLNDEGRSVWIRLIPGTNTLELTSPDAGTLTVDLRWYRRRL